MDPTLDALETIARTLVDTWPDSQGWPPNFDLSDDALCKHSHPHNWRDYVPELFIPLWPGLTGRDRVLVLFLAYQSAKDAVSRMD